MKSRLSPSQILMFCLLTVAFTACNPPEKNVDCQAFPVNTNLPAPVLLKIYVGGKDIHPDNLHIKAVDEDLVFEVQEMQVDSYCFKVHAKGLSPCGIASCFPQARFTFLPGGQHELEYWIQKDGASSIHQKFQFNIPEEMMEKTWYLPSLIVALLLIAGAIVYFWALYNIRQNLKMQYIRSRIAADLHDEVSSDLSSIAISMTILERRKEIDPAEFSGTINDIKQTLSETQNNLSDTVWAIKPDKDTGGELFQRMQKFAMQMLAAEEIHVSFQNSIAPNKSLKINMEQRHNIYKIYKEAIHNIYKHASATEVEIKIYPHPDGIGIEIYDNGIGFDLKAEREGSGITNYFWRAKEQFIELEVVTATGSGTRIKMIIPQL